MTLGSVAILGRSPKTAPLVVNSTASEIWCIGVAYKDPHLADATPPLTRVYEIHPQWFLSDKNYDALHWAHMMAGPYDYEFIVMPEVNKINAPHYLEWFGTEERMLDWARDEYVHVPNSRNYPIGAVMALQHKVTRAGLPNRFLTNSIDFAIAHAILEERPRIEIYGVDLDTKTEYAYQRPGVSFWLGIAAGRGIEVELCYETPILRAKMYALELGGQMVPRQKLEFLRGKWTDELLKDEVELNHIRGRLQAFVEMYDKEASDDLLESIKEVQKEFTQKQLRAARVGAARQTMQMLIDECDLQEPSFEIEDITQIGLG